MALLRSAAKSAIWSLSGEKRTRDQAEATSHFGPNPDMRANKSYDHGANQKFARSQAGRTSCGDKKRPPTNWPEAKFRQ